MRHGGDPQCKLAKRSKKTEEEEEKIPMNEVAVSRG
jgi:hypothetical protein